MKNTIKKLFVLGFVVLVVLLLSLGERFLFYTAAHLVILFTLFVFVSKWRMDSGSIMKIGIVIFLLGALTYLVGLKGFGEECMRVFFIIFGTALVKGLYDQI